ncbi:DNA (cytosine-5-)-methyltransferase [Pontibacter roseus]|uniref:DNA (cytosine-5-)-methyltransferase n=1 Tax=Pontibacter roseus TaxID=336989 RepID=UPI00035DF226|nr:DNA (cytosine-5-)-methyltransferase [Pontibacter roseus]
MSDKVVRVAELFAGVGGFRLGLEGSPESPDNTKYKVVFSNQWEPSTKAQHASQVYEARWGSEGHTNMDIAEVPTAAIPDHDLLVGGFPCQDYSVATTLKNSKGLIGKKGVLWWQIHRILTEKEVKPDFLLFENVDRLLNSPAKQRGRDFALILKSLNDLGYAVEWRILNAADYGMPQRRRRVFFMGYRQGTQLYEALQQCDKSDWLEEQGVLATAFPCRIKSTSATSWKASLSLFPEKPALKSFSIAEDLVTISETFNTGGGATPFENAGVMVEGEVYTAKTQPLYDGPAVLLRDVLQNGEVTEEYFIPEEDLGKWEYLKGGKNEVRKSKEGFEYRYSEGGMVFPDNLEAPSRTIITGEGGKAPSRFKHVVRTDRGLRRLTPVELERLNMFPDNHTHLEGMSDVRRAFFMGNALVVGVVERLGAALYERINQQ